MADLNETEHTNLTRREALKLAGMAAGGLAIGGAMAGPAVGNAHADTCADAECICSDGPICRWDHPVRSQRYTYFEQLPPFYPFRNPPATKEPLNSTIPLLGKDEMRITFMGSSIPGNLRKKQQMMSVFVEVGWNEQRQTPLDNFVFDCGSGVCTNYNAMNVGFGRMDKVFINHLHGDHMSDLTHIYCCMVITVSKNRILKQKGEVSEFEWNFVPQPVPGVRNLAKYNKDGVGDPYAQIDESTAIPACDCDTGECNYRADGY